MNVRIDYIRVKTLLNYFRSTFKDNNERFKQTHDIDTLLHTGSPTVLFNYFAALQACISDLKITPEDIFDKWYKLNQDQFITIENDTKEEKVEYVGDEDLVNAVKYALKRHYEKSKRE